MFLPPATKGAQGNLGRIDSIGWEAGLPPPSPHTTGRTVPYHGGWIEVMVFRHGL